MRHTGATALRLTSEDIKVKFMLCTVALKPSIERELALKQNGRTPVSYPTVRGEIRTYVLGQNDRTLEINNPFNSRIPNMVVIGLVASDGFNGGYGAQPFAFRKFNLSSIHQLVRGEGYPYQPLELVRDNATKDILGYSRFLEATGCMKKGKSNMLQPEEWGQGKSCTLYAFDNTANGFLHSSVLNPKLSGELRYVLRFGGNPGTNVTVVVYGEFEGLLEIDSNRAVLYNLYDTPTVR